MEPLDIDQSRLIAQQCDDSIRKASLIAIYLGLGWLLFGTLTGLLTSLKFNFPDFLSSSVWLSYGRTRPIHLNAMVYGWACNIMFAIALWLMARLVRSPSPWQSLAKAGVIIWNIGVLIGIIGIYAGQSDGMEWLEMDRYYADPLLILGAGLIGAVVFKNLSERKVKHLYVSVWYVAAAFIWFPVIFILGNLPQFKGVENAAVNWFYAHNALGLWLTAINLGLIYYLIPKILGRPIYSYWLSLVGFWSLAFFYSLNGMHHLIGGPLPTWMITTSIVASIMMVVPVFAVAVNHHMTMVGRFTALRYSPTLTFIVLGAMAYTGVSLQGVMQSLVEVNRVTHFTHWTVGHAHMGVYGFVSFTLFGALYYLMPRLLGQDWLSSSMIRWHFWLVMIGIFLYVFGLAVGGVLQGLALNNSSLPFEESVRVTKPWLWVRTIASLFLSAGHIIFVVHIFRLHSKTARVSDIPPWHEVVPIVLEASDRNSSQQREAR